MHNFYGENSETFLKGKQWENDWATMSLKLSVGEWTQYWKDDDSTQIYLVKKKIYLVHFLSFSFSFFPLVDFWQADHKFYGKLKGPH